MIYISYLVKLEGYCQENLIVSYFWGQFLRKIGWFKILEVAVSPACPAIAYGDGGSNVEGANSHPDSIGHLYRIHLVFATFLGLSIGWFTCQSLKSHKTRDLKH